MKEIPCACIHRKHFCRNPASDALDGQQPTNEKKRTFSYLAMEGEARTASILSQYNGLWYECDRSMSKTIKRGIFECSSVLEDRFPRILWEEKVEPAEPAKRQQICHFIMEESLCIPRRARLLRSKRISSHLHRLQESSLVASSFYQFRIRKTKDTSLCLETNANVDECNFVKDEDEMGQDSNGFDCHLQIVA
ncbi:hypothetical protein IV203_009008 [Nitzschia inconspicua]|uniref:Uncharacterized protein n=1 Tax=Nitzschia inconspicua TaxID=303405 RepID=A0A9K3PMI7_9STRA|nr:hypothetical protein IV203_009008 [Nitzschia inconspicua]